MVLQCLNFVKSLLTLRASTQKLELQQKSHPRIDDHPPPRTPYMHYSNSSNQTTVTQSKIDHSPISELPQELIDKIIDTLFYDAYPWSSQWRVLSSCSLVCKSFLPRCQMHMFTHVTLPGKQARDIDYMEIGTLLRIIDACPSIANHIREIHLVIHEGRSMWIYDKPEMIKLLCFITESSSTLEKLVLSATTGKHAVHIPMNVMDRFIYPHIASSITSLHLDKISGIPPELVFSCVNLQDLVLKGTEFQEGEYDQPRTTRPRIQKLEYVGRPTELSKVSSGLHLDFSNLRNLTIDFDHLLHIALGQEIVNAAQGSLEKLIVRIPHDHPTNLSSVAMNLENQPRLHSMGQTVYFSTSRSNNLVDICSTLKTISTSNNCFSTFGFTIRLTRTEVDGVRPQLLTNAVLDNADWETLGSEICRIAGEKPFRLILWMVYSPLVYEAGEYEMFARYRYDIQKRFKATLQTVIEERLVALKANPWIVVTQSIFLVGTTLR